MTDLDFSLQHGCDSKDIPSEQQFKQWIALALAHHDVDIAIICIRLVGEQESAELNQRYRQKAKATNVLSFHYDDQPLSGDLAICSAVMTAEAATLAIEKEAHWAHITIHGILHLLGYDHQQPQQAEEMERLETALMKKLGYDNPYQP